MAKPMTAVLFGTVLGFFFVFLGQKTMNAYHTATCKQRPDYYRLVTYKSYLGDAKYCIHTSYLSQ